MAVLPTDGWRRVPPGELDRLQQRLRRRRWTGPLTTALLIVVAVAALAFGTYQAASALKQWTAPPTPPGEKPCIVGEPPVACPP